jgi:hypothetical protein
LNTLLFLFVYLCFALGCIGLHGVALHCVALPTKGRQNTPKLTETFSDKLPHAKAGTDKYWDAEIKGLVLFVGKRSKTWYFQKDVGGQTKRILIGRFPIISAQAARQTALGVSWFLG